MHPQEFVAAMLANGRNRELVQMLDRFCARLHDQKTAEHSLAYGFVNMFLVSVKAQILTLEEGKSMDDDKFLSVWKSLGLFGIDREEIPG